MRALDGMWVTLLGEVAEHAARTPTEVRRNERIEAPERSTAP
ncbi:hypothetical protein [Streptomyces hirsutus]